jgi:hypothetical protein
MSFQRRHYELIANTLRSSHAKANTAWDTIVSELADTFAADNHRFSRSRFLEAARGKATVIAMSEAAD